MLPTKRGCEEKEAGNRCFKESDFRGAVLHYTRALSLGVEESHKVFCNRSLAQLRLGNATASLLDADQALQLDPSFLKVKLHDEVKHPVASRRNVFLGLLSQRRSSQTVGSVSALSVSLQRWTSQI